jgi:hypothetical protein
MQCDEVFKDTMTDIVVPVPPHTDDADCIIVMLTRCCRTCPARGVSVPHSYVDIAAFCMPQLIEGAVAPCRNLQTKDGKSSECSSFVTSFLK